LPQFTPSVAFGDQNYLAAWFYQVVPTLRAGRVDDDGSHLDGPGLVLGETVFDEEPSVAFDGENYLVAGSSGRITGARVSPDGTVLATGIPLTQAVGGHTQREPSLAFDGTSYVLAYHDSILYSDRIRAAFVSPLGVVQEDVRISNRFSWRPAVAAGLTNSMVVWVDSTANENVWATRVRPDGTVLDPTGIPVSTGDTTGDPSIAFDGENYLVVWAGVDVYAKRITQDGAVLDQDPIPVSTAPGSQSAPTVAFRWGQFRRRLGRSALGREP
jgi:hypothetical protein